MKPISILLVWPILCLVSVCAQSHRFGQPLRRRRINQIETTESKEETDTDSEVKRLIDIMIVNDEVEELLNKLPERARKHKSKKKKAIVSSIPLTKIMPEQVNQVSQEPVLNGQFLTSQHSGQKIRSRGRQIPTTRISSSETAGRISEPYRGKENLRRVQTGAKIQTTTTPSISYSRKFRSRNKPARKITKDTTNTQSGDYTYPTERIIIRVPKVQADKESEEKGKQNIEETERTNSLSFLKTFLKTYEENSVTTPSTTKVTIPSEQERDSLLKKMLNKKKINDTNLVANEEKDVNQSKRLRRPVGFPRNTAGRRKSQRRPQSEQKKEENLETATQATVFRSNKQTINNIYNIIEQAEHVSKLSRADDNTSTASPISLQKVKLNDETMTNTTLEKNSKASNLFLSTFMGVQRTKRPNMATSKMNTSPNVKHHNRHQFSLEMKNPSEKLDISINEKQSQEKTLPPRPVNHDTPNIRGRNSLFSRLRLTLHGKTEKGFDSVNTVDNQPTKTQELKMDPDSKQNQVVTSQRENVLKPSKQPRARFGSATREGQRKLFKSANDRKQTTDRTIQKAHQNQASSTSTPKTDQEILDQILSTIEHTKQELKMDTDSKLNQVVTSPRENVFERNKQPRARFGSPTREGQRKLFKSTNSDRKQTRDRTIQKVQASSTKTPDTDQEILDKILSNIEHTKDQTSQREHVFEPKEQPRSRFDLPSREGQRKFFKSTNSDRKPTRDRTIQKVQQNQASSTRTPDTDQAILDQILSNMEHVKDQERDKQSESNLDGQSKTKTIQNNQRFVTQLLQPKQTRILESRNNLRPDAVLQHKDKEYSKISRTTKDDQTKGEEKSPSRAGFGIRGRGGSRKKQNNSEPNTSTSPAPFFQPTRRPLSLTRPVQIKKKLNYSDISRKGQEKHDSSDAEIIKLEENKDEDNKTAITRGRLGIQGRGRSRSRARDDRPSTSRKDSNNKETKVKKKNETSQLASRSRVNIPGNRRSRPSTLPDIGVGLQTSTSLPSIIISEQSVKSHDGTLSSLNTPDIANTIDPSYTATESSHSEDITVKETTQLTPRFFPGPRLGVKEHKSVLSETTEDEIARQSQNNRKESNKVEEEKENRRKVEQNTQNHSRHRFQIPTRSRGSPVENKNTVAVSDTSQHRDNSRRSQQRGRFPSTILNENKVGNTVQEKKINPRQPSRSRARGRQNVSTKNIDEALVKQKLQEVTTNTPLKPQLTESNTKVITGSPQKQKSQEKSVPSTSKPKLTEDLAVEHFDQDTKSFLTFDPFAIEPKLEKNLEYHFFPAESDHSKENFRLHVLTQPEIQIESNTEGNEDADLSKHLSSALDLATVTWTQDPYREEAFEEDEGKAVFDIDFSKNPNNQ